MFKMLSLHNQKYNFEIFPSLRFKKDRIIQTLNMKYNKCSKHKEEGILDDKQCKESVESLNFELLNIDTNDKNEVFDEEKDVGTDTASINFTRV